MGYILVDNFDDYTDLAITPSNTTDITIGESDWASFSLGGRDTTTRIIYSCTSPQFSNTTYIEKTYDTNQEFVVTNAYNEAEEYPWLLFSLQTDISATDRYYEASDFYLTFGIYKNGTLIREWFFPLSNSNGYKQWRFDLKPLIDAGETYFNKIRLTFNKESLGSRIYLGQMYFFQDEKEHNILSAVRELFNNKIIEEKATLKYKTSPGMKKIYITSDLDLFANTAILIGDKDGVHELHVISTIEKGDSNAYELTFTGEFGGKEIQYNWPVGEKVYFTIPATFFTLDESEAVFPVFYIKIDAGNKNEYVTGGITKTLGSYVKNTGTDHLVLVGESGDSYEHNLEVQMYSTSPELAMKMKRFFNSVFDDRSTFYVAGSPVTYQVTDVSEESGDNVEFLPYYRAVITVYIDDNLYYGEYQIFPPVKSITYQYVII